MKCFEYGPYGGVHETYTDTLNLGVLTSKTYLKTPFQSNTRHNFLIYDSQKLDSNFVKNNMFKRHWTML